MNLLYLGFYRVLAKRKKKKKVEARLNLIASSSTITAHQQVLGRTNRKVIDMHFLHNSEHFLQEANQQAVIRSRELSCKSG